MNKVVTILITSLFILSCNNKPDTGKFKLSGEIKNLPDQKIYLEQLFFSQNEPAVLDTAEAKNGKFELSAIALEECLYRIRPEKIENGFLFINDLPTINFNADAKNITLEAPEFNSPANVQLKKLMIDINNRGTSMSELAAGIDRLKTSAANDSLLRIETSKLNELGKSFQDFIIKFIDTVSSPVIAMFALNYTQNINPAALKNVIPNLATRFPTHQGVGALVSQYNQFLAQQNQRGQVNARVLKVGSMAPDFTMNDVNGKPFSLNSLRGKYVLVDFWASWCGPCRSENPYIVAAYNQFKDKNFTILGVSLDDDKANWISSIEADKLSWQQVSDLKGMSSPTVSLYGFEAIPYNVLLDPQGKIIAASLRGEALQEKLSEVLP